MRTYSYIIVDDDNIIRIALDVYLQKYPFLKNIASFSSPVDAEKFLEERTADILFSDIEMPDMDGLTLFKKIKEKVSYTVFVTSYSEFALDSYELSVNDYLLKPIDIQKLDRVIKRLKTFFETKEKAALYEKSSSTNTITVKEGYNYRIVNTADMVYLSALKDYTKIILDNGSSVLIYGNLSTIMKDERFASFVRIHKSYAVKRKYIKTIIQNNNQLILFNDIALPIGRTYKKEIIALLS